MTDDPVVPVPADLDAEERVVGPFGFRALAWLSLAAAGAAFAVSAAERHRAVALLGLPLALAGVVGAWWRPADLPPLSWLRAVWAYHRRSTTPTPMHPSSSIRGSRLARVVGVVAAVGAVALLAWLLGTHLPAPSLPPPSAPAPNLPAPNLPAQEGPAPASGWDDCGC
jgi:hypothetical protein